MKVGLHSTVCLSDMVFISVRGHLYFLYKFISQQVFFLSCLSLQDYVHDRNAQQTKKEKKNLQRTEDWTNGGFTDKQVSTNWEWNTCFLVWWRAGLALDHPFFPYSFPSPCLWQKQNIATHGPPGCRLPLPDNIFVITLSNRSKKNTILARWAKVI
jgi:hypothetical protein